MGVRGAPTDDDDDAAAAAADAVADARKDPSRSSSSSLLSSPLSGTSIIPGEDSAVGRRVELSPTATEAEAEVDAASEEGLF